MNKKKVIKKPSSDVQNKTEKSVVKESFLNSFRFIVHRFEINDPASPNYYIVGFKVICDISQRDSYVETQVSFKECDGKSDNEICVLAYENLKTKIDEIKKDLLKKKFIVGSEFVPPQ